MMSEQYWEIVEYECQDGKCLMIHNIPNDSKLGALSLDHRDIGEAIIEKLNEQQSLITALEKEHKRQENQIKLLNKQLSKIPPNIREVWLYD